MTTCPNCGAPNRENARFCIQCGNALVVASPAPSGARVWLAQIQQSLAQMGRQGASEARIFRDEWIAPRPVIAGTVIGTPRETQVTITQPTLFPRAQSQAALCLQVQDAQIPNPVDVMLIGVTQGTVSQDGDGVLVWGRWDDGLNAYRTWRVQIAQRAGQSLNLEFSTARPFPFGMLVLILLACLVLTCVCRLFLSIF